MQYQNYQGIKQFPANQMKKTSYQVAVITGGMSGLGLSTANLLLQLGYRVGIFDKKFDRIVYQSLKKKFGKQRYYFVETDVSSEKSVKQSYFLLRKYFKINESQNHLVAVANCAGVPDCNLELINPNTLEPSQQGLSQKLERIMKINFFGSYLVSKHGASIMAKSRKGGVIINVASIAGIQGTKEQFSYASSKGAIIGATMPMARSLGKHGIRVVTIAPGPIDTGIKMSETTKSMTRFSPIGRFGKSQDFASLVHEIMRNGYLNGRLIVINMIGLGTTIRLDGGILKPHI